MPQSVVMIYAPRDAKEIEVVAGLVAESYRYACTGRNNGLFGLPPDGREVAFSG